MRWPFCHRAHGSIDENAGHVTCWFPVGMMHLWAEDSSVFARARQMLIFQLLQSCLKQERMRTTST